ncbi:MAG: cupin domain-containing protein [Candidatus Bathyarchaeia archaeon]
MSYGKEGYWNVEQLIKEKPRAPDEQINWNFIANTKLSTLNIAQIKEGIKLHVHKEHDEIIYFFSGEGEFNLAGRKMKIKPGDITFVPAGTPHGGQMQSCALVSIYSPYFDKDNPDRVFVE